jgi:hypothetical protein
MSFRPPPATACWQHLEARSGFEVAYFQGLADGLVVDGTTAAVEDGQTWVVTYSIALDAAWVTRSARITARSGSGSRETLLAADGAGTWLVNGGPAAHLDGCLDVDLESSAMTNTLPVHRLALAAGGHADAPAAYVRGPGPERRPAGAGLPADRRRRTPPALRLRRAGLRLYQPAGLRRERTGAGLPGHRPARRLISSWR